MVFCTLSLSLCILPWIILVRGHMRGKVFVLLCFDTFRTMVRPQMVLPLYLLLVFTEENAVESKRYINLEQSVNVEEICEVTIKYILETKVSTMIHLIIHPKITSDISDIIIQTCLERVPTLVIKMDNRTRICKIEETCAKVRHLIAIYNDLDDVKPDHFMTLFHKWWSPRSPKAIWILNGATNTVVNKTLENFWSCNSLNIVLLILNKTSNQVTIFSYDPFLPTADGQRGLVYQLTPTDILFPDKLTNLHKYPIPISMYHRAPKTIMRDYAIPEKGIDVQILRVLIAWLNFTMDLKTARTDAAKYVVHLPNGDRVGMIGDLLTNKSSVLWNTQYIEVAMNRQLEFVGPVALINYCVVVPKSPLIPLILQIFVYVPSSTTIAVVLALGFLILCLIVRREKNVMLKAFNLFLFQQFPRIGGTNFDRIFSITWIIWSLVIITMLQSGLINNIMIPRYYEDINTLEQLYDSKLTLMIGERMLSTLKNSYVSDRKRLADRAIEQLDFDLCAERLIKRRDVACGIDRYSVPEKLSKMFYLNNREHAHVIKENLNQYWLTFLAKDGFPFLNKFKLGIQRLDHSGINKKWYEYDLWLYSRSLEAIKKKRPILTMNEFYGLFYVLFLGYGVSTLVFIIELSYRGPTVTLNALKIQFCRNYFNRNTSR